ncbi:MAG: hypothetical protein ACJA0P_002084, partial [Planctomycetota bacterium]
MPQLQQSLAAPPSAVYGPYEILVNLGVS